MSTFILKKCEGKICNLNKNAIFALANRFFRFQVHAQVAELVDALDSKSSTARCAGSIPALGTKTRVRNKARATFLTLVFFFALIFFLALLLILMLSLYYLCINMYLIRQLESYKRNEKQSENDVWSSVFLLSFFAAKFHS